MSEDIIKTWSEIIDRFKSDNQCGFCWNFFAPLTEVDLNLVKEDSENECCCVNVFIVRNKGLDFSTSISYNVLQTITESIDNEFYDVYFLIKSSTGINNYNEMPNHPISESRHKTIFKPLRECITADILTNICEIGRVSQWNGTYVYDYQDEMYFGIKLSVTQQINNYEY